jgi:TolB-like protein/DNA-binding winged helix-turn-helix (wHTH) protein/Tfp pilus assembly protein PilF
VPLAIDSAKSGIYRFGSFEFDVHSGELRKQGMRIRIEGQPVAILVLLLERRNKMVAREELQRRLWPGDTSVDFEQSLNAAVRRLRVALDDSAESPRFIETLPRKGYRWVAPVLGPSVSVEIEETDRAKTLAVPQQLRVPKAAWLAIAGALSLATIIATWVVSRPSPRTGRLMLAVLPFQNLSNDAQQEFFADGMTEEMITQLGTLDPEHLGVIARTSALQYKATHKSTGQIARELKVDYLLEGGIRRNGQRIRVTAQLIQANDQAEIWADSFESDIADVLKVQSEVARGIAAQIRLELSRPAAQRLSNSSRVNALAHDAYLQGQHAWELRDRQGTLRSIEQFQRAIEIDPDYASAYAALARAYALSPVYSIMPESEAMPKARDAATRAIALDDSVAVGHTMMGFIKAHYEYDWQGAAREFQKAIRLNPSDPFAHLFYSNSYLSPLGRHEEAIEEIKTAIALDPFSPRIQSFLGRTYIWARRYDDALAQFQKTTQMFPSFAMEHERLAHLYTYRGEYDKAIGEETEARILAGEDPRSVLKLEDSLRKALRTRGPHGYWEKMLELCGQNDEPPESYTKDDGLAIIYARLGDTEHTLQALERGYKDRQIHMTEIAIEPAFDPLRSDPRFQELEHRIGVQR